MMKRAEMLLEKWGPYALALLCAAVILLSALWTRRPEADVPDDAAVLSDESQRLSDVTPAPTAPPLFRPVSGEVMTGYATEPVHFAASSVWMLHPAVDFAAAAGEKVLAAGDGTVAEAGNGRVILELDSGFVCLYRGLGEIMAEAGRRVRAGDCLGLAGGQVPLEGSGRICVALLSENEKLDLEEWIDKQEK